MRWSNGPIMSKKLHDDQSYYLKYSEPKWYRESPVFPEGRKPYHDLFQEHIISKIGAVAGKLSKQDMNRLQADLRSVAHSFMTALYTTPLRLSDGPKDQKLSRRRDYLDRHIIKPANLLLEALADANSPALSEWPEQLDCPAPDKSSLAEELRLLCDRCTELKVLLEDRLPNENLTQEFMTDLGNAFAMVLKCYFPELKISRGTYHNTDVSGDPKMHGTFLSVMEICVGEVLPNDSPLSSKLIGELRKLQGP